MNKPKPKITMTSGDNAGRQRKAFARMSLLERECGMTAEEYRAFHAVQRARVLARYGVERSEEAEAA